MNAVTKIEATIEKQLELIVRGGSVKRYHTTNTIQVETVATHSYYVAWFVSLVSEKQPSSEILLAALQHDIAEAGTGDIPAPAKRKLNVRQQFADYEETILSEYEHRNFSNVLSSAELRVLKLSDSFAGMLFCIQERTMGNMFVSEAFENFRDYATELRPNAGKEQILMSILYAQWRSVNVYVR